MNEAMYKKSLFGTSGIRGDAEKLFTPQFCFDLGFTFVEFLRRKNITTSIAIGMDPRTSSPRIKKDLARGFIEAGVQVFDEGVTPIPSINWLIKNTEVKAAVMITGSHIAPHLNGMKFYAHDEEISEEDQIEIEKIYNEVKGQKLTSDEVETSEDNRARDLYSDLLTSEASLPYPKWKVVIDTANGAQSVVVPEILKGFGFEVVEVNCNVEDDFIARDTDTDDQAVIEDLKKKVVEENCDFGIAFDGDGDRVVFIDEKGEFVQGEYTCSLIAKEMSGNAIVTTISASQVVDTLGKKVIRTKVGSPHVIHAMKENKVEFGFEPNGGAIFGERMYTRDGGSMMIQLVNLFKDFNGKFSEMVSDLPKFYMARTKVEYKWEQQDKIIQAVRAQYSGKKIEDLDGMKIWLSDDSFILFRSSANAPEFRVFAESKSKQTSKKLLAEGIELVEGVINANS